MNNSTNIKTMEMGAVTLLDILGWKGIWQRKTDAIECLLKLINGAQKRVNLILDEKVENKDALKFKDLHIEIKSISDTIALVTYGEVNLALEFHALLTCVMVAQSIRDNIPIRGATSYGEFTVKDNIMVGPAVDEVASWYEIAEWIGVILTPSALFQVRPDEFIRSDYSRLVEHEVPTKLGKLKTYCSNWPKIWTYNSMNKETLLANFLKVCPITPDIYDKYKNTIAFYDKFATVSYPKKLSEVAATVEE